jgi:GTPase KRas protein
MEDSYRKHVDIDSQSCMLEVLDTGGREEYTALRDQWIRNGEGFLLVYSISSRLSFTRIQSFHNQIRRVKESLAHSPSHSGYTICSVPPSSPLPIMLVGNKSDQITEREVSTREGLALAQELGCGFLEASAKNCIAVEDAFHEVVRQLRWQCMQSSARQIKRIRRRPRMGIGHRTTSRDSGIYRSKYDECKCTIL